jgi:hypothetical protein
MAKDMKSALSKSVANERKAFNERIANADVIMGGKTKEKPQTTEPKPVKAKPKPKPAPRPKVIRDSFTMPETDYALFDKIRADCMKAGINANKSEVVRAGLKLLSAMNQAQLREALGAIDKVKPGRVKQE